MSYRKKHNPKARGPKRKAVEGFSTPDAALPNSIIFFDDRIQEILNQRHDAFALHAFDVCLEFAIATIHHNQHGRCFGAVYAHDRLFISKLFFEVNQLILMAFREYPLWRKVAEFAYDHEYDGTPLELLKSGNIEQIYNYQQQTDLIPWNEVAKWIEKHEPNKILHDPDKLRVVGLKLNDKIKSVLTAWDKELSQYQAISEQIRNKYPDCLPSAVYAAAKFFDPAIN